MTDWSNSGLDKTNKGAVTIIGAGLVGCYLAHRLLEENFVITLIDMGGMDEPVPQVLADKAIPIFSKEIYRGGTSEGRVFGIGGTSVVWGGAMIPPSRFERHLCPDIDPSAQDRVLKTFAIKGIFASAEKSQHLDKRNILWPAFHRKNTRSLLDTRHPNLSLIEKASVREIKFENRLAKTLVIQRGLTSFELDCSESTVILCAGMLESTRILSTPIVDHANCEKDESAKSFPSRDFKDHISAPLAYLKPKSSKSMDYLLLKRPWGFESIRYDFGYGDCTGFVNVQFTREDSDAFSLLRDLALHVQSSQLGISFFLSMLRLVPKIGWVCRFFWSFYIRGYVLPPDGSKLFLNCAMAKLTYGSISIEKDEMSIEWEVTADDERNFLEVGRQVVIEMRKQLGAIFDIEELSDEQISCNLRGTSEVFHPNGSVPFGGGLHEIDENTRFKKSENLFVISSAIFPEGGVSSPSFALLCLAEQLVGKLAFDKKHG